LITTTAQATAVATAMLQLYLTAYDDVGFTAVQNAALACGDCITLVRSRVGVVGNYVMSQISMSADVTAAMTVTNRAQRSAA
jgi:hypothetical protein